MEMEWTASLAAIEAREATRASRTEAATVVGRVSGWAKGKISPDSHEYSYEEESYMKLHKLYTNR
jgi:hypothetical protein